MPLMDTCLHLATRRKDSDLVKLFIENGANVDGVNRDGQTILHIASLNGDETIIRYVDKGFRGLWQLHDEINLMRSNISHQEFICCSCEPHHKGQ